MRKKEPPIKTFNVTYEMTDKDFSINAVTRITYRLRDFEAMLRDQKITKLREAMQNATKTMG